MTSDSYPERARLAAEQGRTLTVFVPLVPLPMIAPGSGIVGAPTEEPNVLLCHYEGWINGAMQYADLDARGRWEAAVYHAAGRAFVEYPTIARRLVRRDQLQEVGFIGAGDPAPTVTDEAAVNRWLSGDQTKDGEQ